MNKQWFLSDGKTIYKGNIYFFTEIMMNKIKNTIVRISGQYKYTSHNKSNVEWGFFKEKKIFASH